MRVHSLLAIIVLWLGLVAAVGPGNRPGKVKKTAHALDDEVASPESQDAGDYNPHHSPATPRPDDPPESEVDELEGDSDVIPPVRHVQFDVPQAETPQQNTSTAQTDREGSPPPVPAAPVMPSTPDSLGRLLMGRQRRASDTALYDRPSLAKTRYSLAQNDHLDRKWHPWYLFNNDERRKRHSDLWKQYKNISYNMSSSTGATMLSFTGRPERDPAHPTALGEMTASRDILRNKKLRAVAEHLYKIYLEKIAQIRREEYEEDVKKAAEDHNAFESAVQKYEDALERRAEGRASERNEEQPKKPIKLEKHAGRGKRKRGGKSKARDTSTDASKFEAADEDAPDLDATPKRQAPNLRRRKGKQRANDDAPDADDAYNSDDAVPGPQFLFHDGALGAFDTSDMALDDETFNAQTVEQIARSRREKEQADLRRSKAGESSGQSSASGSRVVNNEGERQEANSSRARITRGRGPEPNASNSSTLARDTGPATRAAAAARSRDQSSASGSGSHASGSSNRAWPVRNVSGVFVGPSGRVPEGVLPRLARAQGISAVPNLRQRSASAQAERSAPPPTSGIHQQQARDDLNTASDSASDSVRRRQAAFQVPAPPPSTNGRARPPSDSSRAPTVPRAQAPLPAAHPPVPGSSRAHPGPPSSRARSPGMSSRARSPGSAHADFHPASIPPTLNSTVNWASMSNVDPDEEDDAESELPERVQSWLIAHDVPTSVWADVEMAYLTGLAVSPNLRRATWTAELEQLQGGLLVSGKRLKELVLLMFRCAIDEAN